MSASEKRLVIVLLAAVGFVASTYMWQSFRKPMQQAQQKLTAARTSLSTETDNVLMSLQRIKAMQLHKARSLSSNVSEASLGYEQWLSDLAENVAKFRAPKVSRENTSPSRDNSYVAVKIRIAGQGTMKQLREFLYRFHRANLLHQISSLTADAIDNSSNPLLDIVIMAEGLSLRDADVKGSTVFPRSEILSVEDNPDRRMTVADATAAWPTETPFEIRVNDQYLTVLERVHQVWEVKGSGTKAAAGAAVTLVEEEPAEGEAPASAKAPTTTKLVTDWDGKAESILVELAEGFDPGSMKVRIGNDELEVVARREVWRIDDQRFRADDGEVVEASPVHSDFKDVTLADFENLLERNPFAKIRTLPPNFLLTGERRVERGNSSVMTPVVQNLGPNASKPEFEVVSELPTGMKFEENQLHWTPPEDMEPGSFDVTLRAKSDALKTPLEQTFKVSLTVTKKNDPPIIFPPEGPLTAVLGQEFKFKITAGDNETPEDQLRFSAGSEFPTGGVVNPSTGEITWMPGDDVQPGDIAFPVTVTDNGDPVQSTSTTITVTVEEDRAIFTYLTASISADDRKQAWFYDRSSNQRVIVQEGDMLEFAGYNARIVSIERDFVTMQQDRDTLRIELGTNLREAIVVASAEGVEAPYDEPGEDAPKTQKELDAANAAELDALLNGLDAEDASQSVGTPASDAKDSDDKSPTTPTEEEAGTRENGTESKPTEATDDPKATGSNATEPAKEDSKDVDAENAAELDALLKGFDEDEKSAGPDEESSKEDSSESDEKETTPSDDSSAESTDKSDESDQPESDESK